MPSDPVSVLVSDLTVGSCPSEGRRRCCSRPQPCLHASTLAIANSALLLPWMANTYAGWFPCKTYLRARPGAGEAACQETTFSQVVFSP